MGEGPGKVHVDLILGLIVCLFQLVTSTGSLYPVVLGSWSVVWSSDDQT